MTKQGYSFRTPGDMPSILGLFSWCTVGDCVLPCLHKSFGKRYFSTRMIQATIVAKYIQLLGPQLLNCVQIPTRVPTVAETILLNEINSNHCNFFFGYQPFSALIDSLVNYDHVVSYNQFLNTCYLKMTTPARTKKCGLVLISYQSVGRKVIPYVVKNNKKYLPLSYFKGVTECLRAQAIYLTRWESAYLKFCCKLTGVQKQLSASNYSLAVSIELLQTYYPEGTTFDEYWPDEMIERHSQVHYQDPVYPNLYSERIPSAHTNILHNQLDVTMLNVSSVMTTTLSSTPACVLQYAGSLYMADWRNLNNSAPSGSHRTSRGRWWQPLTSKQMKEVVAPIINAKSNASPMHTIIKASRATNTRITLTHQNSAVANNVTSRKTRLSRTARNSCSQGSTEIRNGIIRMIPECQEPGEEDLPNYKIRTVSLGIGEKYASAINLESKNYTFHNMATTLHAIRNTYFAKMETKELRRAIIDTLKKDLYAPNSMQFELLLQETQTHITINQVDDLLLVRVFDFRKFYHNLSSIYRKFHTKSVKRHGGKTRNPKRQKLLTV